MIVNKFDILQTNIRGYRNKQKTNVLRVNCAEPKTKCIMKPWHEEENGAFLLTLLFTNNYLKRMLNTKLINKMLWAARGERQRTYLKLIDFILPTNLFISLLYMWKRRVGLCYIYFSCFFFFSCVFNSFIPTNIYFNVEENINKFNLTDTINHQR